MSNENTLTLEEIRASIDKVDEKIITLVAERQTWVLAAGSMKKNEEHVRAPARVEQVISKVRALADANKASPEVVESIYRAMIDAFIDLELAEHRTRR